MRKGAEKAGLLTIGADDPRITPFGRWLRDTRLDELPQLWNVLIGEMSMVGPRPEVPEYVALYSPEQRRILAVRPGLTDHATLAYLREAELLAASPDPERTYIAEILPAKIALNQRWIDRPTVGHYFRLIFRTLKYLMK